MQSKNLNCLVILGPTASGKTGLAARLAHALRGEVLSVDSRQAYRGLDIGSGKDLEEYTVNGHAVPYHLIDIVDLDQEFNVFAFQQRFFEAFEEVLGRGMLPVAAGGTGLYLDAVLCGYRMVEAPENPDLRGELAPLSLEELSARLLRLKPDLHNTTDLEDRARAIRAIEIAEYAREHEPPPAPEIRPLVLGTAWPREELRRRIASRLKTRLDGGLIEEAERLHAQGISWERLELLGLEYRFVSQFLQGQIRNRNDLFQKLNAAIAQFAKRQDTWFRRMERRGTEIHWVARADFDIALKIAQARL